MKDIPYTIYTPDKYLKRGMGIWVEMFRELRKSQELIKRLFIRDLLGRYKQSLFGYLWVIINPFVAIGTFVLLNRAGVFSIGRTDLPYPLFALIGLAVWQLFAGGISTASHSIMGAGSMVVKINFPREALVFSSMGHVIFDFLIRFGLVIIFFFIFQYVPKWQIIFFPFAVIPLLFFTLGISMLLSIINAIIRDTANIISLFITFLMFLTPVLYPWPVKFIAAYKINPLTPLIAAPRDLITYGYITQPVKFWVMTVISVIIFFACWRIFHLAETKVPERL